MQIEFEPLSEAFVDTRHKAMDRAKAFCSAIVGGTLLPAQGKIASRYYAGLHALGPAPAAKVLNRLETFRSLWGNRMIPPHHIPTHGRLPRCGSGGPTLTF